MFVNIEKSNDKTENYEILIENLKYYLIKEDNLITNLANLSSYLNYFLDDINWVGFYLYNGSSLYLGPFQGVPACTSIQLGNGVCGIAAKERNTLVIDDVSKFSNHITCDSSSNSEIVIPIIKNEKLIGVLDIDSASLFRFDNIDKIYLEKVIFFLVDIL